ncbi:uncharacterized protein [Fopius arisanus]|uniref:Odorant receptor n=1 Tax=Fopius arisanus TaxID=64838 RepID=A0A9R1T3A2_9HYME|nr:PREDICTED: uncharacterized protein LOC105265752 [Fopius arisanus]
MAQMLLSIENDWKRLKLQRDIDILTDFTDRGRKTNILYAIAMYGVMTVYLASPGIPKILDVFLPLNESRPHVFLYQTEYFCDQDKYYTHILLHAYFTVPISLTSIIYFDNLFGILVNHTCGMCGVLKSHLEAIGTQNPRETLESLKFCANLQTSIIEFVNNLESACTIAFLLLVGLNMMVVTTTGVMLAQMLLSIENDWKRLKLQRDIDILTDFTDRGWKINILYASTDYKQLEQ